MLYQYVNPWPFDDAGCFSNILSLSKLNCCFINLTPFSSLQFLCQQTIILITLFNASCV